MVRRVDRVCTGLAGGRPEDSALYHFEFAGRQHIVDPQAAMVLGCEVARNATWVAVILFELIGVLRHDQRAALRSSV